MVRKLLYYEIIYKIKLFRRKNDMKTYFKPNFEVIALSETDVLAASENIVNVSDELNFGSLEIGG